MGAPRAGTNGRSTGDPPPDPPPGRGTHAGPEHEFRHQAIHDLGIVIHHQWVAANGDDVHTVRLHDGTLLELSRHDTAALEQMLGRQL